MVKQYIDGMIFGILPSFWYGQFSQMIIGISFLKIVVIWNFLNLILQVPLGYVLTLGKFGFPRLEAKGLGIAFSISYWLIFIISIFWIFLDKRFKKYKLFQFNNLKIVHRIKRLIFLGVPISLQMAIDMWAWTFSLIMVGWISISALTATQIRMQVSLIIAMFYFSLCQANTVLIAVARGKKDNKSVFYYAYSSLFIAMIYMSFTAVLYLVFPKFLISFFLDVTNPMYAKTVHLAKILFAIMTFNLFWDAIKIVNIGVLRGFYDTKYPMWVGLLTSWIVAIPISYVLVLFFEMGAVGIRLGFSFGFFLAAILMTIRTRKKIKDFITKPKS